METVIEIPLASLRFDTAASVRCGIDEETVSRYTDRWLDYQEELAECNAEPPEYPLGNRQIRFAY